MKRLARGALVDGAPQTLWGLIEWRAATTPDLPFLIDHTGFRLSFGEFRQGCVALAGRLAEQGIARGSVVMWQLPTWPDSVILAGALRRLGAMQIPALPLYRQRELGHAAEQAGPRWLFVPRGNAGYDFEALAARVAQDHPGLIVQPVRRGDFTEALPVPDFGTLPDPTGPDEPQWIYFTSGTTGTPKGVLHADSTLIAAGHASNDCFEAGPDDRVSLCYPVTHIGGLAVQVSGALIGGFCLLTADRFGPETITFLRQEGVTFAGSGTAFQLAYVEAQRNLPSGSLFPGVRGFPHGGDTARPHLHRELRDTIGGVGILSSYGSTEFPMIASGAVSDPPDKLETRVGRAQPGVDIRIVGADGEILGPDEEGEIVVRGPSMLKRYLGLPHESAIDPDGFFHTGDLGTLDADGYLSVNGRLKDIIIRKGENISATEVENVLVLHPAVGEVAVVGLPDEERGERCCAVVVLREGAMLDLEEIRRFLTGEGLMIQKVPEQLELIPTLPRDFLGKVQKRQLRADLSSKAVVR